MLTSMLVTVCDPDSTHPDDHCIRAAEPAVTVAVAKGGGPLCNSADQTPSVSMHRMSRPRLHIATPRTKRIRVGKALVRHGRIAAILT